MVLFWQFFCLYVVVVGGVLFFFEVKQHRSFLLLAIKQFLFISSANRTICALV